VEYEIEFKPKAIKDLDSLQRDDARRIVERIKRMQNNLEGDVKHLTNFTPEYRLRVGDFRVLFELAGNRVTVYRIVNRRDAYR
jgi:mRNA interferase RelE/StbE